MFLPLLWNIVSKLIGFAGDVDFVIERTKDLGWINNVIKFSVNPVVQIFLLILGFYWLYIVLKKPQNRLISKLISDFPIKIEYKENDPQYYYKSMGEQLCRISIENITDKTIEDVKVEITDTKPLHPVFKKKLPILKQTSLNPGKVFIDLIRWQYSQGHELYEIINIDPNAQTTFSVWKDDFEIVITVTGKNIKSQSKKFSFGLTFEYGKGKTLWVRSID